MKLDWVVNNDTYSRTPVAVPNGGVVAVPLTFPKMQQAMPLWSGANVGGNAFPTDGDRQYVKAVAGNVFWRPSSWVAGNSLTVWMRIVKKPMDLNTTDAIADALYTLDDADFANERYAWQYVNDEAFNTGANFANTIRVKATVNQWLEPDEALYFICEMQAAGIASINLTMFMRTLMGV